MSDYKTSIGIAQLISFMGWIAVIAGVGTGLSLWLVGEEVMEVVGTLGLLIVPSAIIVTLIGFLLVIGGQASRAVMDNANYSKEILEQMQKNG